MRLVLRAETSGGQDRAALPSLSSYVSSYKLQGGTDYRTDKGRLKVRGVYAPK